MEPYKVDLFDFVDAYERYEGDNVDVFITMWQGYLAGEDYPCPESPTGIHQVTYGSCDNCGDKNRD